MLRWTGPYRDVGSYRKSRLASLGICSLGQYGHLTLEDLQRRNNPVYRSTQKTQCPRYSRVYVSLEGAWMWIYSSDLSWDLYFVDIASLAKASLEITCPQFRRIGDSFPWTVAAGSDRWISNGIDAQVWHQSLSVIQENRIFKIPRCKT